MLDKIVSLIAPHYCCGCDKAGSLLCSNCKYNIISESKMVCLACRRPTGRMWLCDSCHLPYERAWAAGWREGVLQRLIGLYKFERAKDGYKQLGDLLLAVVPNLPANTIVVPVPTTPGRMRERGYDHMSLIARYFAAKRGLSCQKLVKRITNTKQRQADATKRLSQASRAFNVETKLDPSLTYLLVDDVVTTGATIKYAAKALRDAGARHVWVAVIARQMPR